MGLKLSIKICLSNCRDLGGPSTLSQLKEELHTASQILFFFCETKKKKAFVQAVTKKLKGERRWEIVDREGLVEDYF